MSMSIKKGDKVEVLSGKDRGKQGVVLRALPSEGKVIVEGVAVAKKAVKPNGAGQQGGIVDKEMPIDVSNVQLICPSVASAPVLATRPASSTVTRPSSAFARSAVTSSKD